MGINYPRRVTTWLYGIVLQNYMATSDSTCSVKWPLKAACPGAHHQTIFVADFPSTYYPHAVHRSNAYLVRCICSRMATQILSRLQTH